MIKFSVGISLIWSAVLLLTPIHAQADACSAAKREMAYGQAATEDAEDKAGFGLAAAEFTKATEKAPNCAAAFFNLGVVQEKAGALASAKSAYERYLQLDPTAADASSVEQQVFKLEYRIKRAGQAKRTGEEKQKQDSRNLLKSVVGTWYRKCLNPNQNANLIEFAVSGNRVSWRMNHPELNGWSSFSNGEKYNFKTNRFEMIRGVDIRIKSNELLESIGGQTCKYRRR